MQVSRQELEERMVSLIEEEGSEVIEKRNLKKLISENDVDPSYFEFRGTKRVGYSLLTLACRNNKLELAQMLIRNYHVPLNKCDHTFFRCTALHTAIRKGNDDCSLFLLAEGASPNVKTECGNCYFPIHWTASRGNVEVAEALIAAGADINVVDKFNKTPYNWALGFHQLDFANFLIEKGARVEETKEAGGGQRDEECKEEHDGDDAQSSGSGLVDLGTFWSGKYADSVLEKTFVDEDLEFADEPGFDV